MFQTLKTGATVCSMLLLYTWPAMGEAVGDHYEKPDAPDYRLLPDPFPVWTGNFGVINHGGAGGTERMLPTNNNDNAKPGCYVACYSGKKAGAVYGVAPNIFVHGQFRTKGHYENRICRPLRYEKADISRSEKFRVLCKQRVKTCGNDCWAGGDTGGWFGIP